MSDTSKASFNTNEYLHGPNNDAIATTTHVLVNEFLKSEEYARKIKEIIKDFLESKVIEIMRREAIAVPPSNFHHKEIGDYPLEGPFTEDSQSGSIPPLLDDDGEKIKIEKEILRINSNTTKTGIFQELRNQGVLEPMSYLAYPN